MALAPHCALVIGWRGLGMKAMSLRSIAVALAAGCVTSSACAKMHSVTPNAPRGDRTQLVDRVEVRNGHRKLLLLHGSDIVRAYRVQLGRRPTGQKERSGTIAPPKALTTSSITIHIATVFCQSRSRILIRRTWPERDPITGMLAGQS